MSTDKAVLENPTSSQVQGGGSIAPVGSVGGKELEPKKVEVTPVNSAEQKPIESNSETKSDLSPKSEGLENKENSIPQRTDQPIPDMESKPTCLEQQEAVVADNTSMSYAQAVASKKDDVSKGSAWVGALIKKVEDWFSRNSKDEKGINHA